MRRTKWMISPYDETETIIPDKNSISYGSNNSTLQKASSHIPATTTLMTTVSSSSLTSVPLSSDSEDITYSPTSAKTHATTLETNSISVENLSSLLTNSSSNSPPASPSKGLSRRKSISRISRMTSRRTSIDKVARPIGGDYCLNILFMLTMLGYFDRYLPAAMKDHLKVSLHLTDAQTSFPFSVFLIVFMIASPIFASFADFGFDRRRLILVGVLIWSAATTANAFCTEFWQYLLCRGGVGVGEAALVTIAPTLLCDFYPPEERNRVFAWYSLATPFGAGLGFIIGGFFADQFGWRYAFIFCGIPGICLALTMLTVKEPGKGIYDRYELVSGEAPTWKETFIFLYNSKRYVTMNLAYTLGCFAVGALADWFPTFLERQFNIQSTASGLIVGIITIVSTPIGVFGGSYIADKLRGRIKESNFAISALGSGCATLLSFPAFLAPNLSFCISFIFFAETFLWFFSAPWNTELSIAVPAPMRARGFGVAIFCSHAFGDAIASSVIGIISDWTHNLKNALLLVPIMVGLASLTWAIASRCLDNDPNSEFYKEEFIDDDIENMSASRGETQPLCRDS